MYLFKLFFWFQEPESSEAVQGDDVEVIGSEDPGGIPQHNAEAADQNHPDQDEALHEGSLSESSLEAYAADVGEGGGQDAEEGDGMEQDGETLHESKLNFEESNHGEGGDGRDSNPNENHREEIQEADYVDLLNEDPDNFTAEAEDRALMDEYEEDEDQVEKEHAQIEQDLLGQEQAEEPALEEENNYDNQDPNPDTNFESGDESGDQTIQNYDTTSEQAVEHLYSNGESVVDSQGNERLPEKGSVTTNPLVGNPDPDRLPYPHTRLELLNNPKLNSNQDNAVVINHIPANVQKNKVIKVPLRNLHRNYRNGNEGNADSVNDDDDVGESETPVAIPLANPHLPIQVEPTNSSNGGAIPQSPVGGANTYNQANHRPNPPSNHDRAHLVHHNLQPPHLANLRRVQAARTLPNVEQRKIPNHPNLHGPRIHNAPNTNPQNSRNLSNHNTAHAEPLPINPEGSSLEHPTVMMSLLSGSYLKCPVCSRQDPRGQCRPVFWCGVWSTVAVNTSAV